MPLINRRLARSIAQAAARVCTEALEARTLLSAPSPADPPPEDIADKIDQRFYQVAVDVQRNVGNEWVRNGVVRLDAQQRIDTYIHTSGDPTPLLAELARLGAEIEGSTAVGNIAQAWVPADKIDDIARLQQVTQVGVVDYPFYNTVTSAGDGVLLADKVRSQFAAYGIDGTGVKVGVISDGVKNLADVGAELPAVTVQPSHTGSGNEGVAMLEIVHDLAPGAQLYFSAPSSSVDMVNVINYLVGQGCNVIVDDLTFFAESYFMDDSVAVAAQNAINQGVVYVTSAGNYSDHQHYQAQYSQSQSAYAGGLLHRFAAAQDHVEFKIPAGSDFRAFLEWSDKPGFSSNNYDLYLFNSDTFASLDSSVMTQNGNDDPFEMVQWKNNTASTVNAEIWINRKNGALSRELELFTIGNFGLSFATDGDALTGQEAVGGVISVAAAHANTPDSVTAYSSRGGSTIYVDFTNQIKAPRQTLDGTAVDHVQTQIGQTVVNMIPVWPHNPFDGTSAAAPHAAAIAALLKQARPSLTPAQIAEAMADTATDLGAAGYDVISGAGRYNALDAVYSVFTPAAPDLADASDSGTSNSDNLTNVTLPTFNGVVPAGSYVRLFVDGVQSAAVQLTAGVTNYSLPVSALIIPGPHVITIRVASSASVPLAENSFASDPLMITVDTAAPTIITTAYSYDAPGQRLLYTFSENLTTSLSVTDIILSNLTTSANIPATDQLMAFDVNNKAIITFPNYTFGALPDGKYHVTFAPGSVTDKAGNPLVLGAGFDFHVLAGDANLDKVVDFKDLVTLAQNYNSVGGKLWANADFTADSNVDFMDLVVMAQNYNKSLDAMPSPVVAEAPPVMASFASQSVKKNKSIFNTTTAIRPAAVQRAAAPRTLARR